MTASGSPAIGWNLMSSPISWNVLPTPSPDVPVTELPPVQDFDTLLDHALKDLKVKLSKAHARELRRNSAVGLEVSQNGTHEAQLVVPRVGVALSSSQQTQSRTQTSSVCVQDVGPTPVVEPPVTTRLSHSSEVAEGSCKPKRVSRRFSVSVLVNDLHEAVFNKKVSRMHAALADHRVMVKRHLLKQRLALEHNLVAGSWKLLRWLLCFVPLLCCLNIFEPGSEIGNVHEMLVEHYGLGHNALLRLKEWDHVYGFFKRFKEQNDLLEPTGKVFWCDPRYLDRLGIKPAGTTEFARQRELAGLSRSRSGIVTNGSSGGRRLERDHSEYVGETRSQIRSKMRRLSSSSSSSSSFSASTASIGSEISLEEILLALKHVYQNPTPLGADPHGHDRFLFDCRIPTDKELVDIHHKLEQARAGNNSIGTRRRRTDGYGPLDDYQTYFPNEFNETYLAYINHVYLNQTEPSTGTYLSRYHYPYSAVSLFDPVIYQNRYALHECKKGTFADYFTNQGWNILSPVFGQSAPKAVDILECVDRRHHVHDEIADDIDTDRFRYMGNDIYARLAGQAGDHTGPDFSDWQRIGWLGKQTETASISVLIYIDGLEMFTSLSVHFTQGAGGAITCHRAIASVVELNDRGTEWVFFLCSFAACINCVACLIYDLSNCRRLRMDHRRLDHSCLYEVFARLILLIFTITLLILHMGRETMLSHFKDAFDTFLYRSDFSHTGQVKALQHFFEVKEHVHSTDAMHINIKILGTFVYVFQVFQLVLLLGAHPRVDLLCATIVRTINGLLHYIFIFTVIFALLGYYAHWMFSSTLPTLFGSFSSAILRQTEMIVGYADAWPWEDMKLMSTLEFVCFYMYLLMYFALVFLILLNFFIAIILEGFFGVWKALTEENAGGSGRWFPIDMWHAWRGACVHRKKGWPSRIDIITRVESFEQTQRQWDTFESKKTDTQLLSEVALADEYGFRNSEAALEFLTTYALRAPLILDLKPNKEKPSVTKPGTKEASELHHAASATDTRGSVSELVAAVASVGQQEQALEDQRQLAEIVIAGTGTRLISF